METVRVLRSPGSVIGVIVLAHLGLGMMPEGKCRMIGSAALVPFTSSPFTLFVMAPLVPGVLPLVPAIVAFLMAIMLALLHLIMGAPMKTTRLVAMGLAECSRAYQ